MRALHWAILLAVGILVFGLIFGVAGLLLAPIVGLVAIVAIIIWFSEKKAKHEPPAE